MKSILNVKKNYLTWLTLYLVIISALELKVNKLKKKQNNFSFSTKNFWFFLEFLCSISSSHFLPFNFICVFKLQKLHKIWIKCLIYHRKSFWKEKKKILHEQRKMTLNQLVWKLIKENFHPSSGYFERSSKNIYNHHKIMLDITRWTLIPILHIKQSVHLVLANVLSASFLMFHITFDEISTALSIQFW